MRLIIFLVFTLCLAQPAFAESWLEKLFGSSQRSSFTTEERQQIKEYFIEKAMRMKDSKKEARKNVDDPDFGVKEQKKKKGKKGKKEGKTHGKSKSMPPGLAKRDSLPPGLAKQLEKNGTLPPGLAKRSLPEDLKIKLPPREKGQERVIVDDDVILVEKETGKILDIIRDVLAGAGRPD